MKQVVPFLTQRVAMVSGGDACGVICLGAALRESEQLQTPKSKRRKHLTFGALLEVKTTHKTHQRRSTFGSCDVEKVDAAVARSAFPSQNVKSTTCSDHLWTLRCRFAWQAQGIVHLVKNQQKVTVL